MTPDNRQPRKRRRRRRRAGAPGENPGNVAPQGQPNGNVAIPGAIGQSIVTTLLAIAISLAFKSVPLKSGLVVGMAMSVASTVVLIRVLTDNKLLDSTAGHVAVGWLIEAVTGCSTFWHKCAVGGRVPGRCPDS